MVRVRRDPRCSSGTRPCFLLLHSILLTGRQQLCPGPASLMQAAIPAPLSARKSPAPATEAGGAAKRLPAASELQDPSPARAQQSLGGQLLAITALFKQRGGSLALHSPPSPFPAPLQSCIFGEKPLRAALTPALPTVTFSSAAAACWRSRRAGSCPGSSLPPTLGFLQGSQPGTQGCCPSPGM